MSNRKHLPISVHQTLHEHLKVNWEQDYKNEYHCPHCRKGKITNFYHRKNLSCQLRLYCSFCNKEIYLTCRIPGMGLKHSPISVHQTLNSTLLVNWKLEYKGEYSCPHCYRGQLKKYRYQSKATCKLDLNCELCGKKTCLTNQVPIYIYNYVPNIECPNPMCNIIGHDGQKGWIYKINTKRSSNCKCRFCKITFDVLNKHPSSWMGSQIESRLFSFSFYEDTWDLRHFYNNPNNKALNFQKINPQWYRTEVKRYLYYLLKQNRFSCSDSISQILTCLKQFGKIIERKNVKNKHYIDRNTIICFLNSCKNNNSRTNNRKLCKLKDFFEWLELEEKYLIRTRDLLKVRKNDADWLDEVTRKSIKQHLNKIPAPIARHYLVQAYTAARPGDMCRLAFDCLIEDNGRWYINFFQQKTQRWHRIFAAREIREVIEKQQHWIRETFGTNYRYLFCHFKNIRVADYPKFTSIKFLCKTPSAKRNPMVNVIRILIDQENILDANGQKPHFIGKITRHSRLQEIRAKYGMEAAQLYADHRYSDTTFQHYAPPTREQVAEVDLPFQKLLMNPGNKFLPWQSLPESLLKNPKSHELDLEIAPRLVVYGHCTLNPKTPCPVNLFPKCYGCSSFRPSTGKLSLYERQYKGEQQRLAEAENAGAELANEEAKATIKAMDKWLPELRRLANG